MNCILLSTYIFSPQFTNFNRFYGIVGVDSNKQNIYALCGVNETADYPITIVTEINLDQTTTS